MDNCETMTDTSAKYGTRSSSLMEETFSNRAVLWDKLLVNQVRLFSMEEMHYFRRLPEWGSVATVADVGCGSGDYLREVCRVFPDREYWGIDTSDELLEIARRKHSGADLSFVHQNIECEPSSRRYDAIILRFVVQHLSNSKHFFERLALLAHHGTIVVVIEPNFLLCGMRPQLGSLTEALIRYNDKCDELGNSRSRLSASEGLSELVGSNWSILRHETIVSRHVRATWDAQALHQVLRGWCLALAASDRALCDLPSLERDISAWLTRTGECLEMTLNVWLLGVTQGGSEQRPTDPSGAATQLGSNVSGGSSTKAG